MPRYIMRFNPADRETWVRVDVPKSVKGIEPVADYIAKKMARDYARARQAKNPEATAQNWYDSHYDFIEDEITRLAGEARQAVRT